MEEHPRLHVLVDVWVLCFEQQPSIPDFINKFESEAEIGEGPGVFVPAAVAGGVGWRRSVGR